MMSRCMSSLSRPKRLSQEDCPSYPSLWHHIVRYLYLVLFGCLFAASNMSSSVSAPLISLTIKGAEQKNFGRMILTFDAPVKVVSRVSNGILVLSFDQPVTLQGQRLETELRNYIAMLRPDPDNRGLRIALAKNFRPNQLEAGEQVFIDLLPSNWMGLLPALPQEVVDKLAERARLAEDRLRENIIRKKTEPPKAIQVRMTDLPNVTRLIFEWPHVKPAQFKQAGKQAELVFFGNLVFNQEHLKSLAKEQIKQTIVEKSEDALTLRLAMTSERDMRVFQEDETLVLDIPKADQPKTEKASDVVEPQNMAKPLIQAQGQPVVTEAAKEEMNKPLLPQQDVKPVTSQTSTKNIVTKTSETDATVLVFPFNARIAAAAYERNNTATFVFHTNEPLEIEKIKDSRFAVTGASQKGAFMVVQLALSKPQIVRLKPVDNQWIATIGDRGDEDLAPLVPQRNVDQSGRTIISAPLINASGVLWMDDQETGERIAIVTAFGPPRAIVKPRRFVEFSFLPSSHGLAILAEADDVTVYSGVDGVTISRGSGLLVSFDATAGMSASAMTAPVLSQDVWEDAKKGGVLTRTRALMDQIIAMPPSALSKGRLALGLFKVANGYNHEAIGVLDTAQKDNPLLMEDRAYIIPKAVAYIRSHHDNDAGKLLERESFNDDPEALVWRAALDARSKRWALALGAFRRSGAVLDLYPAELQGMLRLLAVRAAIDQKEFGYAEAELQTVMKLAPGSVSREETALLRARIDELTGKPEAAFAVYKNLNEAAERPVAAEAGFYSVMQGLHEKTMDHDEALGRLETLSVIWRGGEIEIASLGMMGKLYAQDGRWREAFMTARRANAIFPNHDMTRSLHDETAELFENLFLTNKGSSLGKIDTLALYFDFREFTPIGRRGDEIIRRLSDRLVELDLLEQAGDLLQHQVEYRLTGAAKATIAARLATIRLMDGKASDALKAIQSTRLPELPETIKRARLLLEARALSDLSRTDLALEVTSTETGPEIDRLRADIYWQGRRWREAGEAHEAILGTSWQGKDALTDQNRQDVIRAAIAYSMGDERISVDRLRAKYSTKMADSSDAGMFATLTQPNASSTRAFREIAQSMTAASTLKDFLREYRKRYPEAAAHERRPRDPTSTASQSENSRTGG